MVDLIARVMELAQKETRDGRRVMVLFPTPEWRSAALPQPENIYLRASTVESGLKSLAIDTLILVGRDHPDWNENGERYARERIRASRHPRVIIAEDDYE